MALDYLDYYGLERDPFEQEIFVPIAGRGAVLDQAVQLLSFSQMIPLIQGPIGSGRTAMLKAIASQLPRDRNYFILSCDQFLLQECSLMSALADLFELDSYAHASKAVLNFIKAQQGHLVLLVDDFDLLDQSSQHALLSLLEHGLALAITVCQLPNYELAGHEYLPLQLEPMQSQDALNYLNQHFLRSGVKQGVPLESKLITRFNQLAQGLPGKLNSLVSQHLRYQSKKSVKQPWFSALPRWHIYTIFAILCLVVISFWLQFQRQTQDRGELQALTEDSEQPVVEPSSAVLDALLEQQQLLADDWQQEEWLHNPNPIAELPQIEQLPDQSAQLEDKELVEPRVSQEPVTSLRERLEQAQSQVVSPSPRVASPAAEAATPSPVATAEAAVEPQVTTAPQVQQLSGYPWLAAVRAGEYSIQLFGSWELDQARGFEQNLSLSQNSAVVVTQREGRPWYVVIVGQYANQLQAQAAIEDLPANLRQDGAWSRTFRSMGLP